MKNMVLEDLPIMEAHTSDIDLVAKFLLHLTWHMLFLMIS